MHEITFAVDMFRRPKDRPRSEAQLKVFLGALYLIDVLWLRQHPEAPDILAAGVRYEREPLGQERWQDYATLLRTRLGDCEDQACARAAYATVRFGVQARPHVIVAQRRGQFSLYHIVVRYPDGRIEDPSRATGMRGHGKWSRSR